MRRLYVRRSNVLEHGPTPRCMGCRALEIPGMGTRTHTAECRARFEKLLSHSEIGRARVDRANDKLSEAIVGITENENKKRNVSSTGATASSSPIEEDPPALVPSEGSRVASRKRHADDPPDNPRLAAAGDEEELVTDNAPNPSPSAAD